MDLPRYLYCLGSKYDHADVVGASLFLAARGIAADLRRVHNLTEIKRIEREDRMISEGTEDGEYSL